MKQPVNENFIIRVKSTIKSFETSKADVEEEAQHIEFMTRGQLVKKGENFYLTYRETETIGHPGSSVTIKIAADASRAALLRFGRANSQMIIEAARRNQCYYETEFGSLVIGVTGDGIECALTEEGGTASINYYLDVSESALMSRNSLEITVTPVKERKTTHD